MSRSVEQPHPEAEPPSTEDSVQGAVLGWLETLWPDGLEDGHQLCVSSLDGTAWQDTLHPSIEAAAQAVVDQERRVGPGGDVYLATASFSGPDRKARSVGLMPALALDLDAIHGRHKNKDLHARQEDLLRVLSGLVHPPSVVLDSGGGLYAFWILGEPLEPSEVVLEVEDGADLRVEHLAGMIGDGLAAALSVERYEAGNGPKPHRTDESDEIADLRRRDCLGLIDDKERALLKAKKVRIEPLPKTTGIEGGDISRVLRGPGMRSSKYGGRRVSFAQEDNGRRYTTDDILELVSSLPHKAKGLRVVDLQELGPIRDWTRTLAQAAGGILFDYAQDRGVYVLASCPFCGGGSRHREGTADISARTGRIRCWRGSCEAGHEKCEKQDGERSRGIAASEWVPSMLGEEAWLRLRDAREQESPTPAPAAVPPTVLEHQARSLADPSWPTVQATGDDLVRMLGRWVGEAAASPTTLQLREVVGGAGKTHALAEMLARATGLEPISTGGASEAESRTRHTEGLFQGDIAVVFRNHGDAEAWIDEYRAACSRLGVAPRFRHVHGVGSKVRTDAGLVDACAKRDDWKAGGRAAQALVRRVLCRDCELFRVCEVTRPAEPDEVVVGVVAGVEAMRSGGFLDDRVVIFDEEPGSTVEVPVPHSVAEAVLTHRELYGQRVKAATSGADAGTEEERRTRRVEAARDFGSLMAKVHDTVATGAKRGPYRRSVPLVGLLAKLEDADRVRLVQSAKTLASIPHSSLPAWKPGAGIGEGDYLHEIGLESLWPAVVWSAHQDHERAGRDMRRRHVGFATLNRDGSVTYEATRAASWTDILSARSRRVRVFDQVADVPVPPAGILVLSATARLSSPILEAVVPEGCTVEVGGAAVESVGPELERLWCQHSDASRRSICPGGRLRRKSEGRKLVAATLLDTALASAKKALGERWDEVRGSVGILTYRPVAKALGDIGDTDDAALIDAQGELLAVLEKHGASLAVDAVSQECRPAVGYWGRDETASNAFRECRVLVLLGQPTPELSSIERQAEATGVSPDVVRVREEARLLRQAELRLRSIRRLEQTTVVAVTRTVPPVEVDAWEPIRVLDRSCNGDDFRELVDDLVDDARRGRVLVSSKPVRGWLEERDRSGDRAIEKGSFYAMSPEAQKKRIQRLIAAATDRLAVESWEVRNMHPGVRGRAWKVLCPPDTSEDALREAVARALAGVASGARAKQEPCPGLPVTRQQIIEEAKLEASQPELVEVGLAVLQAWADFVGEPVFTLRDLSRMHQTKGVPRLDKVATGVVESAERAVEAADASIGATSDAFASELGPALKGWAVVREQHGAMRSLALSVAFSATRRVVLRHVREHGAATIRGILSPDVLVFVPER